MSRARGSSARGAHETARGRAMPFDRAHRRGYRDEPETAVAEVTSRSGRRNTYARVYTRARERNGRYPGRFASRGPVVVASVARARDSREERRESTAYPADRGASPTRDLRLQAFAPRIAADRPGQARIGTAEVMAAPAPRAETYSSGDNPSRIVEGFGSEVAIASPDPGTTRRRNHPIAATALPGLMPPASLEERNDVTYAAVSPSVLPVIYDRDGHLHMPPPLKGSHEVLVHQNTMANSDGLERIADDGELDRLRANRELVAFPNGPDLRINEDLPLNRRCARPWTVLFATEIARDFYERFHQPLQLNSAVRTVSYQARLQRVNGNAAATDGDAASPHLTGQAIDLGKRGMSAAEIAWMRAYLLPLMNSGKIDVEEEFQQACFHISVYRRYAAARGPAHEVAQLPRAGAQPQAGSDSPD